MTLQNLPVQPKMSITVFDLDFWHNTDYGIKLLIGYTETFNFGVSSLAKQNFSNWNDLKFIEVSHIARLVQNGNASVSSV